MKIYMNKSGEYEVMQNGDIYSMPKDLNGALKGKGKTKRKLLKQYENKNGYLHINLGAKERNVSVHRLVASLYVENTENKEQVNHKDGNKQNNHVSNLEWVTRSENMIHSYQVLGQKTNKVTSEETDIEILKKYNNGYSVSELAFEYKIGHNTVRRRCGLITA